MTTIRLLDARRGLNRKCEELFSNAKIAEAIYRYLCDGIEECEDVEPQRWIPIEERPPQFGKDVLVSYRGGVMVDWLTQCEGNAYFYISGVAIQDVDAWRELPEPYKGGDEPC